VRRERAVLTVAAILVGAVVAFVIMARPRRPRTASRAEAEPEPAAQPAIKGNRPTMLYHPADSPYYDRIHADEWFHTAAEAEAAGYTGWNRRRRTLAPEP
jgi:hypothetical protein